MYKIFLRKETKKSMAYFNDVRMKPIKLMWSGDKLPFNMISNIEVKSNLYNMFCVEGEYWIKFNKETIFRGFVLEEHSLMSG